MPNNRCACVTIVSIGLNLPLYSFAAPSEEIIEKIIVSATRRESTVKDVPYNISAYVGDDLSAAGITDFASLARTIPGVILSDMGRGKNGISNGIIMRSLNVQDTQKENFPFTTDPAVSVYLDETPLFANMQLRDMARVEVLRGPQGTLYGSGSLGGTLRYITKKPVLQEWEGSINTKVSMTDESDGYNHDVEGILNIPLSDKLAIRGVFSQLQTDGYMDSDYIEGLDSNGQPTGEVRSVEDINDEEVTLARVSMLFEPEVDTKINLLYNYQKDDIDGSNASSQALDDYESAAKILETFEREIELFSGTIEHDFGFANFTSSTSYTNNEAHNLHDQSYNYGYQGFWVYYAGIPREVVSGDKTYETNSLTQEFRLASNSNGNLDWLIGLYYNDSDFEAEAYDTIHGVDAFFGIVNPQRPDLNYSNIQETEFRDNAVFGELSYHVTPDWQFTVGMRYFDQTFDAAQSITLPTCGEFCGEGPTGLSGSSGSRDFDDVLFKFNTSYNFSNDVMAYFTISEGFRHGGANGVPADDLTTDTQEGGVYGEHPDYLFFDPDESTNYEIGIKGSTVDGIFSYSLSAYFIDWDNPILLVRSPKGGFPVMINAESAEAQGVEAELQINPTDNLHIMLGYTFSDAELTEDFYIPDVNSGVESFDLGGRDGGQLPGIPENSFIAAAVYQYRFANDFELTARMNGSYKDDFVTGYPEPSALSAAGFDEIDSSTLVDASLSLSFNSWNLSVFIDNLTNESSVTSSDGNAKYTADKLGVQYQDGLGDLVYRVRPRTIGLGIKYTL